MVPGRGGGRRRRVLLVAAVVAGVLAALLVVHLLVQPPSSGDTRHVNRRVIDAGVHDTQDIDAAMDAVEQEFSQGFHDCTMTDLWFDAATSSEPAYEAEYGPQEVIVLHSSITVGSRADPSLNRGSGYDWEWILLRSEGIWSVVAHGQG